MALRFLADHCISNFIVQTLSNPLCDTQPLRRGADVVTKKLLSPIWGFSSFLGTGEHPTLRRLKGRSAMPAPQGTDQIIVERYGFL